MSNKTAMLQKMGALKSMGGRPTQPSAKQSSPQQGAVQQLLQQIMQRRQLEKLQSQPEQMQGGTPC